MSAQELVLLLSLCALFTLAADNQVEHECARKVQYKMDSNGFWYGEIEAVPTDSNFLHLAVAISGLRRGYRPTIEFSKPNVEAADDILHNRPVRYKILFSDRFVGQVPQWDANRLNYYYIQPKVEKVSVNDQTICGAPGSSFSSTVVMIQHEFTRPKNHESASLSRSFGKTFQPDQPRSGDFAQRTFQENTPKTLSVNFEPTSPRTPDLSGRFQDGLLQRNSEPLEYCGVPTINLQRRIFPWVAAVFQVNDMGLSYKCGGSLVSDQYVITAAQCVMENGRKNRLDEITVVLGKSNIRKWSSKDGSKMVEPSDIHIHPRFKTARANIALIKLEIVKFTDHIRPVCLFWDSSDVESTVVKKGTVVGWAKDENGELTTSMPVQVTIPILSRESCQVKTERTFCAGLQDGTGPCSEDSGNGFFIKVNGRWLLKGVLSVSDIDDLTCDSSDHFLFMDVGKFKKWIQPFLQRQ